MTPQRFQQIRNIYEAAVEHTAGERQQFIADACRDDAELQAEVGRLLEAQAATVTLREPVTSQPARTDPGSREGTLLGPYELLRQLGHGGMGSVYLARRADDRFQKHVAIKILRADSASADILRRFQREREILAQLDHPNIARLLDAGETPDGLPYFVMEYVEGRNIVDYADEHRLTVHQRLELFRQVCDAVEYAHRRKIVHRDLKPSNVLVTSDGQAKLLDFGIARLTEHGGEPSAVPLTRTGMWLMTPEYASPEQIRGELVLPASDVYSLGVILFELLTGRRPYQLKSRVFHEIVRVICEEPPTRPSQAVTQPVEIVTAEGKPATLPAESASRLRQTSLADLTQQLAGNLDNILLKALDKQPVGRYSGALQFRADLDRHLKGESIWARGEPPLRTISRFASRYRVALVIAATLIAASATGAVRLQWSAVGWVFAAAALIGLWHAATDPKAGRRLAELSVPRFLNFALVIGITTLPLYGPKRWGPAFLAVSGALLLSCLGLLVYWLLRRRWAGPLLLKIRMSWDRPNFWVFFNIATLSYNVSYLLHDAPRLPVESRLACLCCWTALLTLAIVTSNQEFRRDGVYAMGRLIRWSRIAAWSWQDESHVTAMGWPQRYPTPTTLFGSSSRYRFLVLDLHHAIQFLPPARLLIAKDKIEAVEALLNRELGEWPGTAR